MKIKTVETLACDAGWRNYYFVKLTTEDGVVGWSEYDESFGPPGVSLAIDRFAEFVIGEDVMAHERIFAKLFNAKRTATGSVSGLAAGAIENAVLDAKAKTLGLPCHALLGGKIRDRVRVYWSHCAYWRVARADYYGPPVASLDDIKAAGAEAREKGFTALKSGMILFENGPPRGWGAGFGRPFYPELNVDRSLLHQLRAELEAFRDGAGPDMDILLDLNFNAKTEGFLSIIREIADLDLFWIELDNENPKALNYIRDHSPHPISSLETIIGLRRFMPYFEAQSVDVAVIDAVWNGVWQSMKIAAAADAYEVNIAPHNFYGHLATMMNAHFAAAVPNLRIVEIDIDRQDLDNEVFTSAPVIEDGYLVLPDTPGWGIDPVEDAIRARPAQDERSRSINEGSKK
ncbi:MAG: mandelate racemase/muconate lactonizing enzyme family protein [Rhodospirillales bacterium]|nr:mandelate racemase/muconate lactonizing enzyme family protein [Rhodospirillales bacterium]